MDKTREHLLREIQRMDKEAKEIVSLVLTDLPVVNSDLYMKIEMYDRDSEHVHPADRLGDYRIMAGRLAIELTRLENIAHNMRRRVEKLSNESKELLRMGFWNPEEIKIKEELSPPRVKKEEA